MEGLNTSCDPSHMDLLCQSILLVNVQALDNKLDNLHASISFQQDIRNCNVLWFTETWLNPGIPDSAIQPGDSFSVFDRGFWQEKRRRHVIYDE